MNLVPQQFVSITILVKNDMGVEADSDISIKKKGGGYIKNRISGKQ